MRIEPIFEPIERLLEPVERFGGRTVGGERIAVAGHARERLNEAAHAFVEFGVVRRGHLILAVELGASCGRPCRAKRGGERGRRPLLALVRFVEDCVS